MGFDTKSRCKTALKHLGSPFSAIYHHLGRFRTLYGKSNFRRKLWFWWFFTFHNIADYMAGWGQNFEKISKICSLKPKNISKYLGWWFMMIRRDFKKSWKITFSSDFVIFEPIMTKSEKNMIFHDFLKSLLIIIKHHPRYLEMFLGFKEHVFDV